MDSEPYVQWWCEYYGVAAESFSGYRIWQSGKTSVWIAAAHVVPGDVDRVDGVGIPFLRINGRMWKPTSVAAVQFGLEAVRNVVELEPDEAEAFLRRDDVAFAADDPRRQLPNRGFVIVRLAGVPLGAGGWRYEYLESMIPKGRKVVESDLPRLSGNLDG